MFCFLGLGLRFQDLRSVGLRVWDLGFRLWEYGLAVQG